MFLQKRIGHALTFAGEEGSANLSMAIALAQFMCCRDHVDNDSCGSCPSCVKFNKNIHPDVHFYFPTTTSTSVPKNALSFKYYDKWREFLSGNMFPELSAWLKIMDSTKKEAFISADESLQIIKDLSLKSYESAYRFAMIWLPEKFNVFSSNKLLKIIEEPPEGVFFFLITENPDLVLQTIISRTQLIRIGLMSSGEMEEWVSGLKPEINTEEMHQIIRLSEGNPQRALKVVNKELVNPEQNETFIQWARLCYKAYQQLPELIDFAENMASLNRDEQKSLLEYGLEFFRNGLLVNNDLQELIILDPSEQESVKKFAPLLNTGNCHSLLTSFDSAIRHLERYASAKILFLNLSLDFARYINSKNVNL